MSDIRLNDKNANKVYKQAIEKVRVHGSSYKSSTWSKPTMRIRLEEGAIMPTRAHEADAGLDLYAKETYTIKPHSSAVFDTGVAVGIPRGFAGFLKSKSGLNFKHSIVSDGTIDAGYTGTIKVKLYNLSDEPYTIEEGHKITQLVIQPVMNWELTQVDELEETDRGTGGFGSTGK